MTYLLWVFIFISIGYNMIVKQVFSTSRLQSNKFILANIEQTHISRIKSEKKTKDRINLKEFDPCCFVQISHIVLTYRFLCICIIYSKCIYENGALFKLGAWCWIFPEKLSNLNWFVKPRNIIYGAGYKLPFSLLISWLAYLACKLYQMLP